MGNQQEKIQVILNREHWNVIEHVLSWASSQPVPITGYGKFLIGQAVEAVADAQKE